MEERLDTVFHSEKLNVSYGEKHVLKDVDLDIYKNKVTALIGPSGCGKSTFLRCLNRMNDLIEGCKVTGTLQYREEDISQVNPMLLRTNVGMVFQNPNPFPMSIFDNIAYGPRCHGIKNKARLKEIVEDALEKASLYDEVKDRLYESGLSLSGGQQQRLCIARAIAMSPEVLLMDEPTSALDPIATLKIEELISELKKQYTIVIVTHNMQQAMRVSDYTAFFMLGDLIEYDLTEKIFINPTKAKTKDYISGKFS